MGTRTNNGEQSENGVHGAPAQTSEGRPAGIDLARGVVQEHAQDLADDQSADLQESTGAEGQALQDDVRNVEVGGGGDIVREKTGRARRVFDDLGSHTGCRRRNSHDEENLNDLEGKVEILGCQFHLRETGRTTDLGHEAEDDRQQGHQDRHQDRRQQGIDDTAQPVGCIVDKVQPRQHIGQGVEIGDGTDKGGGNRPEDNESENKPNTQRVAHDALPPFDPQVLPDHLGGVQTDVPWGHMQRQVVRDYVCQQTA